MEDADLRTKLESLERKIDAVFVSAETTRKYFLWTQIATLVAFVLPLVGLIFAIPQFLALFGSIATLQ